MTICRPCSGEATKVSGGREIPRGCKECVAQSLIKCKANKLGIMSLESARKLCSCLDNDHNGELELEKDETIEKMNKEVKEEREKIEQQIPVNIYDIDKQKSLDFYNKRKEELKIKDEQNGNPNWVLEKD